MTESFYILWTLPARYREEKMKVLVLLSGGVDSSTCLALAKEKYGDNVLALSMSYGQKHAKELAAAQAIADYYHVELLHMDLSKIFAHSKCSLLQGSEESVPHASYAEQLKESKGEPVSTYVPFRNGLFLSAAASIALEYECNEIYYGPHADDAAGNAYPDCSVEFNESMNLALYPSLFCRQREQPNAPCGRFPDILPNSSTR